MHDNDFQDWTESLIDQEFQLKDGTEGIIRAVYRHRDPRKVELEYTLLEDADLDRQPFYGAVVTIKELQEATE